MVKLSALSEKYEGGGPATISTGEGDSAGGVSYGTYQLSTKQGSVQKFLDWCRDQGGVAADYGAALAQFEPGSEEFSRQWRFIAEIDREGFGQIQTDFVMPQYYDAACKTVHNMGVNTDLMADALK